ncbi:MAG: hypothetical protein AB1625_11460, partial [Acidobacteriota bacterium]
MDQSRIVEQRAAHAGGIILMAILFVALAAPASAQAQQPAQPAPAANQQQQPAQQPAGGTQQQQEPVTEEQFKEEVTVTGTLIPRPTLE